MKLKYRYKPPISFLLSGIISVALSVLMGYIIFQIDSWELIVVTVLAVLFFLYGLWLGFVFINNIDFEDIELSEDYIKVPAVRNKSHTIKFKELKEVDMMNYPEYFIFIRTKNVAFAIKKSWMTKNDFFELGKKLEKIKKDLP